MINKTMKTLISSIILGLLAFGGVGCMRPVEPKVLATANPNETMFLVPLQGENRENQSKFNSEEYYNQQKVAVREVMIPHRWLDRGRFSWTNTGQWIPTAMVIKVDRTPVTVEFDTSQKTGEPIWVESSDSVGFSTGFSISGMIEETNTAKFLYRYQAKQLRDVIQTEVRARIQSVAAEYCAGEPLDTLRAKKSEMMTQIKDDIIPFFEERGITITTIGQFGGFEYENKKIQEAIDGVFITQQEKEKAKALLTAQKDINAKSEQATQQERANIITLATGEADATKLTAQALADAILMKAKAEASGIEEVNSASEKAKSNPLFLELKKLEVEKVKFEKWLGGTPTTIVETDGSSGMNFFVSPATESGIKAAASN